MTGTGKSGAPSLDSSSIRRIVCTEVVCRALQGFTHTELDERWPVALLPGSNYPMDSLGHLSLRLALCLRFVSAMLFSRLVVGCGTVACYCIVFARRTRI